MVTVQVVVGGQYGSEGKGAVVGKLAQEAMGGGPSMVTRVAGPNAGHSAIDDLGRKWALRHVPAGMVTNRRIHGQIAAGSEVNFEVLRDEIQQLDAAGMKVSDRLWVSHEATVLEPHHIDREHDVGLVGRIGSTGKGIGAARQDRLARTARRVMDCDSGMLEGLNIGELEWRGYATCIIEGTQGYGLGLRAGFYPQCTSSDCRAIDFLAMAGVSPWDQAVDDVQVWVVYRTFPIRVAGNSGPMVKELDWVELAERSGGHIKPERTTVTQKIRRVGEWDAGLARVAARENGGTPGAENVFAAFTFLDYIDPTVFEDQSAMWNSSPVWNWIYQAEKNCGLECRMVGYGPGSYTMRGGQKS